VCVCVCVCVKKYVRGRGVKCVKQLLTFSKEEAVQAGDVGAQVRCVCVGGCVGGW